MAIAIGDKFVIHHEPRNWVLEERVTRTKRVPKGSTEKGETYEGMALIGYFSSLGNLVERMLERQLEGVAVTDLASLVEAIRDACSALRAEIQMASWATEL